MLEQLLNVIDFRVLAMCLLLFLLTSWYLNVRMAGLPPGPFPIPVFGNLFSFTPGQLEREYLVMSRRYGDVFMVYFGGFRSIVIGGYDNLKEFLTHTGDDFIDRPKLYVVDISTKGGKGVIMSSGTRWRESRKFTLMSMRDFGVGRQSIQAKVIEEATALCQLLQQSTGKATDMKPLLTSSVSNVICSIVFGRRFEFGDPQFREASGAVEKMLERASGSLLYALVTFLPWIRFLPKVKTFVEETQPIETFIRAKIAEHRSTYQSGQPPRDFVDLFLQVEHGESGFDHSIFDEDHMYVIIYDLFIAGTETTTTTLLWAILYLSLHEEMQQRCREEILSVLGSDGIPEMEHRRSMPFVEATILETLRVGDIVALGVLRCATKDTMFRGFRIPKGTLIQPLIHSAHRDETVWPEPDKFRPERWLDAEKRPVLDEHLLSFSMGRRSCLGENLAKVELFLFLTMMLQKYSFSIPKGESKPSTEAIMGVTRTPKPFKVLINEVK